MIRVRDFAKEVGCTPQNIYLHLKNYAAELEGHTVKDRRSTLLDEYAQDFIRGVMYPKELGDNALMAEVNDLRGKLFVATQEVARLTTENVTLAGERDKALLDAGEQQRLLQASTEDLTKAKEEAQNALQEAAEAAEREKATLAALEAERAEKEALRAKIDAYEHRTFLQRLGDLFNKGV